MRLIGRHITSSGGISAVMEYAAKMGSNTAQIFMGNPRSWNAQMPNWDNAMFESLKGKYGISELFVHMPYLPNLASSEGRIIELTKVSVRTQIKKCNDIGIENLVVHLGSTKGRPKSEGIANAVAILKEYVPLFNGRILIENEAGQNNNIGASFEDLAEIRDSVDADNLFFCIDTCHAFAYGYDIRNLDIIEEIDAKLGMKNVKALHCNDALFGLGSKKDRHANIGFGEIGRDALKAFIWADKTNSIPVILETPSSPLISESEEIALIK